jgi:hypothetical protein
MARLLVGLGMGAALLAALLFATQSQNTVECEICMEFRGHSACRTAAAADRDAAVRAAVSTACAVLSSGVTQGLECDRTPLRSVRCSE